MVHSVGNIDGGFRGLRRIRRLDGLVEALAEVSVHGTNDLE